MKKKTWRLILGVIALVMVSGGLYAYKEFSRKVKDLSHVRADITTDALQLIRVFENDEKTASAKYIDQVVAVNGRVKNVEKNDQGHYTVIMGDENSMSSVRCSMDSLHQQDVAQLSAGATITMKGACTGFNKDDLLGSDVILNRCVVQY